MKKSIFVIIAVAIACITSCKKMSLQTNASHADFPLAVGSWWRYQVVHFSNGQVDTMTVTASSKSSSGDTTFYVFINTYLSGFRRDSSWVIDLDTAVSVNYYPGYLACYLHDIDIHFPLVQGWHQGAGADNSYLKFAGTVNMNGHMYNNVYLLVREKVVIDSGELDSIYIAPGIGIIKYIEVSSGWGQQSSSNTAMIDYHLAR